MADQDLLDEDGEDGFLLPVAIDQGLQGQGALASAAAVITAFFDLHALHRRRVRPHRRRE
jgi:hypothetical protein